MGGQVSFLLRIEPSMLTIIPMMKDTEEFQSIKYYYNNLRYYRLRRNLTLRQLSERTHLSSSYLSRLELSNAPLSPNALERLSKTLRCDPEQLVNPGRPYH
jgi:DNA-binding Xre family transcriptional regulator